MSVHFSPVITAQQRLVSGFASLRTIDLHELGVWGSPLAVLDDFRVRELPFSPHPHAGFAAVTYVFRDSPGGVRSRTSTGADLIVDAGGIVWTRAGSGLVHEEVPAERGRELHGLQLFVNSSSRTKLSAPRVLSLDGSDVPNWRGEAEDRVSIVVGSFAGISSPLVPDEPFALLDVELRGEIPYTVKSGHNTVLYVVGGSVSVLGGCHPQRVNSGEALALSGEGITVGLEAACPANFLVLSGARIDEPILEEGSFIMNDRAQVEDAMARYRRGAMGALTASQGD